MKSSHFPDVNSPLPSINRYPQSSRDSVEVGVVDAALTAPGDAKQPTVEIEAAVRPSSAPRLHHINARRNVHASSSMSNASPYALCAIMTLLVFIVGLLAALVGVVATMSNQYDHLSQLIGPAIKEMTMSNQHGNLSQLGPALGSLSQLAPALAQIGPAIKEFTPALTTMSNQYGNLSQLGPALGSLSQLVTALAQIGPVIKKFAPSFYAMVNGSGIDSEMDSAASKTIDELLRFYGPPASIPAFLTGMLETDIRNVTAAMARIGHKLTPLIERFTYGSWSDAASAASLVNLMKAVEVLDGPIHVAEAEVLDVDGKHQWDTWWLFEKMLGKGVVQYVADQLDPTAWNDTTAACKGLRRQLSIVLSELNRSHPGIEVLEPHGGWDESLGQYRYSITPFSSPPPPSPSPPPPSSSPPPPGPPLTPPWQPHPPLTPPPFGPSSPPPPPLPCVTGCESSYDYCDERYNSYCGGCVFCKHTEVWAKPPSPAPHPNVDVVLPAQTPMVYMEHFVLQAYLGLAPICEIMAAMA